MFSNPSAVARFRRTSRLCRDRSIATTRRQYGARARVILPVPHPKSATTSPGEMSWDGLRRGVPFLLEALAGIRDASGGSVRFTWLLRSDEQMASTYGDAAYIADEFADFWRRRRAAGDEIGWHPHTWRYSEAEHLWYQEHSDEDWVRRCLREGFSSLARRFPVQAAKPGWTYHDNKTMRTFAEL